MARLTRVRTRRGKRWATEKLDDEVSGTITIRRVLDGGLKKPSRYRFYISVGGALIDANVEFPPPTKPKKTSKRKGR